MTETAEAPQECRMCLTYKPHSEFYRNVRGPSGLHSYCKDCMRKDARHFAWDKVYASIETSHPSRDPSKGDLVLLNLGKPGIQQRFSRDPASRLLERAADIIEGYGWCQYSMVHSVGTTTGDWDDHRTLRFCATAAVIEAFGFHLGPDSRIRNQTRDGSNWKDVAYVPVRNLRVDSFRLHWLGRPVNRSKYLRVMRYLYDVIGTYDAQSWNDQDGREDYEVIDALREAARRARAQGD